MGRKKPLAGLSFSTDHWMWLCALAFWQLLLMREDVALVVPVWYPQAATREVTKRTPGQVQRVAFWNKLVDGAN